MSEAFDEPVRVTRCKLPDLANYTGYLRDIWESGQVTNNGPKARALEASLAERFASTDCLLTLNGTLALQLTVRALGLTGSVVTTPFTYVATTNALLWEGLTPVFADVEPEYLTIDPARVEEAIRPDTTAILATHVYGFPCANEALADIARKHDLRLIYDAAHAFDVALPDGSILRWGDASILSFHATKTFHTVEGGAVVTQNEELAESIRRLRSFGHVHRDYHEVGINAKMSELHAAMGLANLPLQTDNRIQRRRLFRRYQSTLRQWGIRSLTPPEGLHYNFGYLPIVLDSMAEREAVVGFLNARNVFPRRYFEPSLNTLPFLPDELKRSCPVSEAAARTVLCLPLYEDLPLGAVDRIATMVVRARRSIPVA